MVDNKVFNRGDVYFANMGEYNGSVQGGTRPVVIIQNDIGNRFSPTVIVAIITSQTNKRLLPTHIELDHKYIGLYKESIVTLEQIRTVNKTDLISYVGCLSKEDMNKLDNATAISLDLINKNRKSNDDEVMECINDKIKNIEQIDSVLRTAFATGVNNNEFLTKFLSDREGYIKDLEEYCIKNNKSYTEFYNPNSNQQKLDLKKAV